MTDTMHWLDLAGVAVFAACFALRAVAIRLRLALPAYRGRPGRDYPLE